MSLEAVHLISFINFPNPCRNLLGENKRDTVNIVIPDVEPSILKKVVEYIYFGTVEMEPKFMAGEKPSVVSRLLHKQTLLLRCRFHRSLQPAAAESDHNLRAEAGVRSEAAKSRLVSCQTIDINASLNQWTEVQTSRVAHVSNRRRR